MDVVSWRIFWLEFESVYEQLEAGKDFSLPYSRVSFQTWTQIMRQYADSLEVEVDVQKWIGQSWSEVRSLPKDLSDESDLNTNASAQLVRFTLSEEETGALTRSGALGLDVERILISAIAVALGRWQDSRVVYFDRLVHGRNVGPAEFDFSRTIGCVLGYAPTLLKIDTRASVGDILFGVSEQMEQVGDSGTSIDLCRYWGSQPALVKRLEELPRAEVLFNYRGNVDSVIERSSLFDKTREIAGLDHNPEGLRQYPISVVSDIIDGRLELRFVYSTNMHKRESIEALCAEFTNFLRLVVNRPLLPHHAIPSVDTEKQLETPTAMFSHPEFEPETPSVLTGYAHPGYAASLAEFGVPRHLPRCDGWILERTVPGSSFTDAIGCYPLFCCSDWSQLSADLEAIETDLVSVALVAGPLEDHTPQLLADCFPDVYQPFKEHLLVDLTESPEKTVCAHHRRNVRKGLRAVQIEVCADPSAYLDDWDRLYNVLVDRHGITGLQRFSRASFAAQMATPGMVAFRAVHEGETVGMILFYRRGDVAYYHLGAYSEVGYQLRASFALFWRAIEYFADIRCTWLELGAGAGLKADSEDGLTRFKAGWATEARPAYFCGRILDHERYALLVGSTQPSEYFPAYRRAGI